MWASLLHPSGTDKASRKVEVGVEAVTTPAMRGDQQHPPIDNENISKSKEFLGRAAVLCVELDPRAMRKAQELGADLMTKPADASILACAITAGCHFLYSTDEQLIKAAESFEEVKVSKPPSLVLPEQKQLF